MECHFTKIIPDSRQQLFQNTTDAQDRLCRMPLLLLRKKMCGSVFAAHSFKLLYRFRRDLPSEIVIHN